MSRAPILKSAFLETLILIPSLHVFAVFVIVMAVLSFSGRVCLLFPFLCTLLSHVSANCYWPNGQFEDVSQQTHFN